MKRFARLLIGPPDPLRPLRAAVTAADAANAARDWPQAERLYADALRVDPLRDDLWIQYGHMLKEQGRKAEAEEAYASAHAASPLSREAARHLREIRGEPPVPERGAVPLRDIEDLPLRSAAGIVRPEGRKPGHVLQAALAAPSRLVPGPRRDPMVFLHLHKTGGLTLDDVLAAHFAPARICPVKDDHLHVYDKATLDGFDFLSGHFDVGALKLLGRPARTLSMFREPAARLISFYRFHAGHDLAGRHGVNDFARMANALTAEEFFENERVRRAPEVFNHYLAVFSLTYAQVRAAPRVSVADVPPEALPRAIARVEALDAIGLMERFDQSVALACATFGLPAPATIRPRNQTNALALRMKGAAPPPVAMTPRLQAALADLLRFDQPIYAAARAAFEARWAALGRDGGRADVVAPASSSRHASA